MYKHFVKRTFDIVLSFLGIIVLALPMLVIAAIIKIDSAGPVFFKQKRVGIHKTYFNIIKFRSMSTNAPGNIPTHMLEQAESYISPFQAFIRRSSIDELPQLFCIFTGKMSIIGPRPALWNQYDLIEERDKYGANNILPGLSGWAQINGRDVLPIEDKAKLDGEYSAKVSFKMDCKCFWGTVVNVLHRRGVVEGGTGELKREAEKEAVMK